jgi:hypothetical protein
VHPQIRYNAIMQAFPPCLADIMQLCKFFLRVFHLISLILFISHFKGLTCLFIHEINYVFVCFLYFIKLIASMHHVTSSRPRLWTISLIDNIPGRSFPADFFSILYKASGSYVSLVITIMR